MNTRWSFLVVAVGVILVGMVALFASPAGSMLVGKWMGHRVASRQAELRKQCPKTTVPPNAGSLPVHVTVWGNAGPAVWLLHGGVQGGIGGGPETFASQEALANRGWQVHLVDRPGFGQSPSRGPDNMDADAGLIANMLGVNSNLIGHSFGGAEALLAAAQRPHDVRSLILVEPALKQLIAGDSAAREDSTLQDATRSMAKPILSARTPVDVAHIFAESLGSGVNGGPNPSAMSLEQHPDKADSLGCALLEARIASTDELRQAVQTIVSAGVPVLIISGGYDKGQDATAALLAKQLHGEHVVVRAPNHFVQQDNPTAFNNVVDDFMRKADAQR